VKREIQSRIANRKRTCSQELLPMPNCHRCHQFISSTAITCPHCGTVLKAYGHPGITLHRAQVDTPLCESCTYHADDSCNFPQRPLAMECTLYDDMNQRRLEQEQHNNTPPDFIQSVKSCCQRHPTLVGLLGLAGVSVLLTLIASK
jgi:hypothetical protein